MIKNIVIATCNVHKKREIAQIWHRFNLNLDILTINDLGIVMQQEETGNTFAENATQKALQVASITSYPVLADDSGLEVAILDGRPGIFSARYAGPNATDFENNQKLISELQSVPYEDRKAKFRCVIALVWSDNKVYMEEGICEGHINLYPTGENGFGYDPYFFLPQYDMTMAQLDPEVKNRISHRAMALKRIAKRVKELLIDI